MLLSIAWRNLWRNSKRSGATIAAMTLSVFMLIFYSGLSSGMLQRMESKVLDYGLGDAQVFHPDYRKSPSIYERIEHSDDLVARLEAANFSVSPRLLGSGLAAAGDASAGVSLLGLDVARDQTVSRLAKAVAHGQWLDPTAPQAVVLGGKLAAQLGVDVGAEIVVLSQGADGSTANELYEVRGILGTVTEDIDRGGVLLNLDAYRSLMVVPEGVHQLVVRFPGGTPPPTPSGADPVMDKLRALTPGLDSAPWRSINPGIASMLDSASGAIAVMMVIVYLAIGIVILNAMLMAVFERIREFGVLKALGVGPFAVFRLIMLEALLQGCVAASLGTLVALPVNWFMVHHGLRLDGVSGVSTMGVTMDAVWKSEVSGATYAGPIVLLFVFIVLAAVVPAVRAALTQPATSMRHT